MREPIHPIRTDAEFWGSEFSVEARRSFAHRLAHAANTRFPDVQFLLDTDSSFGGVSVPPSLAKVIDPWLEAHAEGVTFKAIDAEDELNATRTLASLPW